MASQQVLVAVVLAILAVVLPQAATATEYVVGDAEGWKVGVNYTDWAAGKEFEVGDTLVFKYDASKHNVYKVNGPDFKSCTVPTANAPLKSGSDVITLAAAGKKWYICGTPGHCASGQKLVITVLPALQAPVPAPAAGGPTSGGIVTSAYPAVMAAASAIVMMIFV